ncbi:hypothetical protein MMN88_26260, partial [Escherichia coli]|nr:hypothetical protein [Escherichia coli]MCM4903186.1 hypothetical protein [Escherichia coli]MCM4935671.1 hypothetical protein [Escherichia coli]MCM4945468.1 hypothetical protein [Escherichia coli]MCM4984664.1 hypothetical protein [Escherichia coli]
WKGWAILLRQKQKKLIMLPSETMIWQPEFTDKTLSRKPGAVQVTMTLLDSVEAGKLTLRELIDTLAKDKNYKASKWDQRYREFTTLLQQTLTFAEPETDV